MVEVVRRRTGQKLALADIPWTRGGRYDKYIILRYMMCITMYRMVAPFFKDIYKCFYFNVLQKLDITST